jgi:hypothetical protein
MIRDAEGPASFVPRTYRTQCSKSVWRATAQTKTGKQAVWLLAAQLYETRQRKFMEEDVMDAEDCARAAHKFNTHFFQGKPRVQVAVPALCEVIGSNDPDEGMGSTVPYSGEYVLMLPDLPTEEVKKFLFDPLQDEPDEIAAVFWSYSVQLNNSAEFFWDLQGWSRADRLLLLDPVVLTASIVAFGDEACRNTSEAVGCRTAPRTCSDGTAASSSLISVLQPPLSEKAMKDYGVKPLSRGPDIDGWVTCMA